MTLRLILTRHAKSSWDNPLLTDHDRILNRRGRASAAALGRWLAEIGQRPDQALVSSSERTRETWDILSNAGGFQTEAEISPALYLSEPDTMLSILKGATGKTVQIIAHNPGISFFARSILDTAPIEHLFDRYPTGATTLIDFEAESWSEVTWRSGFFVDFAVPRALIQREEEQAAKKAAEAALSPSDTPPDTPTEPLSA